jgi:putative thioredoxin
MSIPNVKLFYGGNVVGEFAGALPKFQVEQWLAKNIPDPSASVLKDILAGAATRPRQETLQQLRQFVASHPDNKEAGFALARLIIFEQPEEAVALVEAIRLGDALYDAAEDVRTLAQLMQFELENGSPAAAHLSEARKALATGGMESAIQKTIEATMTDKSYRDDLPRRSAIALFHLLGSSHELTKKYRRRFDMALY